MGGDRRKRPKVGPGSRNLYIRLDPATRQELDELAAERGVYVSMIVREAIAAYLAGGAAELIREKERLLREHGPTTAERALLRWFRRLQPQVRERVFEIGTALQFYLVENGELAPQPPP